MTGVKTIRPQEGYQINALSSSADIVIGGGAAGVGKTFCILLEALRHIHNPDFGAVFFRRTSPMIKAEGGLWDASQNLYSLIKDAEPKSSVLEWLFDSGAKVKFSHLEHEKNIYDWQGSEIPLIVFDELTHFSKKMFFYLLTRNRSTSGIKPYIRATCNPDPDSWVADMISWWIGEDGFPIKEHQGRIRYFMIDNDNYIWGDSREEVIEKGAHVIEPMVQASNGEVTPESFVKSLEFIAGDIYQNKELLKIDPAYLGNLNAQDEDTKNQLLKGNWKVSTADNDIYDYNKFKDIFTNAHVKEGYRYLTCDIALKGSDKLVVFAWSGRKLIDFEVVAKSKGNDVIDVIKKMSERHRVPNSNIIFDNDGVGGFIDGFIDGAVEFKNGGKVRKKANYPNLKTQCYYLSGDAITSGDYFIDEEVANRMYDSKDTLRQRLIFERKAIKKAKADHDGKLRIIDKSEQKVYLGGQSPDLLDAFMMREYVDIKPKSAGVTML
jgi:hypothetical protein